MNIPIKVGTVILSAAMDLACQRVRSMAALRMTGPMVVDKIHNRRWPRSIKPYEVFPPGQAARHLRRMAMTLP